jgi:TetR/AcrR family transcriptional repressor of mexJK operon
MRKRSEDTKKVILLSAQQLFLSRGYRGTTIDAIATAAGVTKRTVYGYFPDKRALFKGVIDTAIGEPWEFNTLLEGVYTIEGVFSSLYAIAVGINSVFSKPWYAKLFRVTIAEVPSQPDLRVVFERGATRRATRAVAVLLRTANARGITAFRDPEAASRRFVGGFFIRVLLEELLQPDSQFCAQTPAELSDYVVDFLGGSASAKFAKTLPVVPSTS